MPLPPNESDFPAPFGLAAGLKYIWTPQELMKQFQDQGYFFTNQFCDSNGVRYNLMSQGKADRMLSSDNCQPDITVHFPDAWLTANDDTIPSNEDIEEEVPPTSLVTSPPEEEFSLDG